MILTIFSPSPPHPSPPLPLCTPDPSILPEVQSVFGHMLESKLQFYAPENFWNTFKLWGQPVNVREQQDAYDFFCNLTDQIDEKLKVLWDNPVLFGTAHCNTDQSFLRECNGWHARGKHLKSVSVFSDISKF